MMGDERLAILIPDLRGGGAERVVVNLANGFAARGYSVDVLLMSASGDFLGDLNPAIQVVDLKVNRMRSLLVPLALYLREKKPDALLACMWPLSVIALWARVLAHAKIRIVVAEHTTWSRSEAARTFLGRWPVRTTMKLTFPYADGIVAVSKGAADDLAQFAGIDRSSINAVYNPVVGGAGLAEEAPRTPRRWCQSGHFRLLAVGALKPIKDYPTLLRAFALVCERVDARLLIFGEGESRSELSKLAASLGIEGKVDMPGFRKDLAAYYQHADLHVLSSRGEGFGNVLVEALAAGTPVVSTDCQSGPREILCNGRYGRLVPIGSSTLLAEAMLASLSSTSESESLQNRAQYFSIDQAVELYLEKLIPKAVWECSA